MKNIFLSVDSTDLIEEIFNIDKIARFYNIFQIQSSQGSGIKILLQTSTQSKKNSSWYKIMQSRTQIFTSRNKRRAHSNTAFFLQMIDCGF